MAANIDQHALIHHEEQEESVHPIAIEEVKKAPKQEIVIKAADLALVQNATGLSRQDAISLIQSANCDIKEALRKYLKQ